MKKHGLRLCLATGLLLLLTGCFSQSVDELYAPPRAPDDYLKLDDKINEVLNQGGEYAAPLSGELTQKVQLQDLDGDGNMEAIAFFRVSTDERPLKIYIYRQTEEDYEVAAIIEGTGTAINSVSYVDLDDSPSKEIVVSWQMYEKTHALGIYSIDRYEVVELVRTDYTDFCLFDLDGDSQRELIVLQTGVNDEDNRAELYNFQEGVLELESSAPLSRNVTGLADGGIKTGYLRDRVPALFIPSYYKGENGLITDIFAWRSGRIENITLNREGESENTIRLYTQVSGTDINGDGVMELTAPYALPDPNSTSAAVNFWAIRWRQFDVNGTAWPVFTTYHNVRDGWYFILPDEWENKITISRSDLASSGERAVVFSYWEGGAAVDPAPFLVIYQLTGDNRYMRANMTGRFRLHTGAEDDSETLYAARFVDCDWDCGLDETGVQENCALIVSDWSVTT